MHKVSIQQLDADKFRQELAGLTVPGEELSETALEEAKEQSISLCCILAKVFGNDLDRKTLWERIGNGLEVCAIKSRNDIERFLNELFDYVRGSPGDVAANDDARNWIDYTGHLDPEIQRLIIRVCTERRFIIVLKARNRWKEFKELGI
ncbi:MAG: hypothetical protein LBJ41_01720 [Treponema sp.]|jgi:hypothetical protein|nr:hypothetical protein [Treponema sp.]